MRRLATTLVALLTLAAYGCVTADVPALSPRAQQLRTGKSDPDPGMQELGQIEAVNGSGCGGFGAKGTYEGALNDLKNRGAAMNADYVEIFTVTEPHSELNCYVNKFVIRGTAFKVVRRASAPTPTAGAAAPGLQQAAERGGPACDPPCSPGFACVNAVCAPVCNPPCENGEFCSRKRICEPAAPAH